MRKQSEVRHTIPIQVRCQPNPFAESVCLSVAGEFETDAPGLFCKRRSVSPQALQYAMSDMPKMCLSKDCPQPNQWRAFDAAGDYDIASLALQRRMGASPRRQKLAEHLCQLRQSLWGRIAQQRSWLCVQASPVLPPSTLVGRRRRW